MYRRAAPALVALLALAACNGQEELAASPEPQPEPTVPVPTPIESPAPVLPLTGEPAPDGVPDRPVLVVKVDNTASARPQVGLAEADIMVEELVEGGMTRLAAMYHSALPEAVAPVRSVRTSDIGVVAPTGGALVASGGAQRVLRTMDEAGLVVVTEGAAGFSRDPTRPSVYSVVLAPEEVLGEVADLDPPSTPYLPWAPADVEPPPGEAVTEVSVRFSGAQTTRWEWTGDAWRRLNDLAAEGEELSPDTVLTLRVAIRDAGYTDPAGNFVPETVLEGSGEALLFTTGRVVEARWAKEDAESPLELTDADGADLVVPAGRTWIEMVPEAGDITWN